MYGKWSGKLHVLGQCATLFSVTMAFEVHLTRRAARDIRKLQPTTRARVAVRLEQLRAFGSEAPNVRSLVGSTHATHRTRVGEYRPLLRIESPVITVLRVLHRREAYR